MITIYSTFNIAILSYMSYFTVCSLSASEWIVSRFMALYKCRGLLIIIIAIIIAIIIIIIMSKINCSD